MTCTHQASVLKAGNRRFTVRKVMIHVSVAPLLCVWTSSFTQDYSLNTIFCGPTNTHNPLFVVTAAVIKDLCCGSRKYTQTRVRICRVRVHVCVPASVFVRAFFRRKSEGGVVTGKQLATASHPPPDSSSLEASQAASQQKQLELSPLRCSTFSM